MENNFYVGIIHHRKKLFKISYSEKVVLYSEDNINFLDLISGIWYTLEENSKDYVDIKSIVHTDISLYKEDYIYLLNKHKENKITKTKKKYSLKG